MAKRKRRRRQVPEVLWRASGSRARTLEAAILSLLPLPPPSPAECHCRGRGCLGCGGAQYLLRQDEPADYRDLLTHTFCIISDNAPQPPVHFLNNGLPQRLIIKNTMDLIMDKPHLASNLLLGGYNKNCHFSPGTEYLCTHAWNALLTRIGDSLMVFLLEYSSIFISLTNKNHYQVTGPPLNTLLQNPKTLITAPPASRKQQSKLGGDHIDSAYTKKRKRGGPSEKPKVDVNGAGTQSSILLDADGSIHSDSHPSKPRKRARHFSWQRRKRHKKSCPGGEGLENCVSIDDRNCLKKIVSIAEDNVCEKVEAINIINSQDSEAEEMHHVHAVLPSIGSSYHFLKYIPDNRPEMKSQITMDSLRMLGTNQSENLDESGLHCLLSKSPQAEPPFQELGGSMNQRKLHSHFEKSASVCFSCLIRKAPKSVAAGDEIKRSYIFYTRFSPSVFPQNHILNRLKPNNSGAISLMKHIFGIPDSCIDTHFKLCTCCNGYSAIKSKCLYHSLLGLLKSLIRNVKHCRSRKLFNKHCFISPDKSCNKDCIGTSKVSSGGFSSLRMFKKRYFGLKNSSCNRLPTRNESSEKFHSRYTNDCEAQFSPVGLHCEHKQVVSFIWAVTRSIVPADLLGDSSNWRALSKNISKFVRLRRFERFCLKQCIHGLKTSCYPFLSKIKHTDCICESNGAYSFQNVESMMQEPVMSTEVKISPHEKFFCCWIYWFFSYLVVPLIGANFYVTERESGKQDVFYYPKPVWQKLVSGAITCLNKQNFKLMDNTSLMYVLNNRSFGFSKVRFLPKEKSLRALANLKAPSKMRLAQHYRKHLQPVNSSLRDLHIIFRQIKVEHPQTLGESVFDYNDVYQKVLQFLYQVKNGSSTVRPLYIVVADVSKAFDSINQDVLLGIVKDFIQSNEYLLKKYVKVKSLKKSVMTMYDQVPFAHPHSKYEIEKLNASIQLFSKGSILIDNGFNKRTKQDLHHLLHEHLKHNFLQFGREFYLQTVGIPQGSLLSSLLCSFYYGHLETTVILPYLEKIHEQPNSGFGQNEMISNKCISTTKGSRNELYDNLYHGIEISEGTIINNGQSRILNLDKGQALISSNGYSCQSMHSAVLCANGANCQNPSFPYYLLLRLIDDYLFISTSKKQAASFYNRMRRGFSSYNCFMNNEKFWLNFDVAENSNLVKRVYTGADHIDFLPWSGLLINCLTLEIQADYTRYCGVHMSSTITVQAHSKPAFLLKAKLCHYMQPKCHPIFYDSRINSPKIVSLNAYQAFLLCAMKFHCYICSMPDSKQNPSYLLQIIERSFSYMYKLIKKRMHDMEISFNVHPILYLKKAEMAFLGFSAYIKVLGKKQSRHRELLSLLRSKLVAQGRKFGDASHLSYAVDGTHSSMFWKFRF